MNFHYDITSWLGSIKLVGRNISKHGRNLAGRFQLRSDLGLRRLTSLLENLQLLPPSTRLAGSLHLNTRGFMEDGLLAIRTLDTTVANFSIETGSGSYSDDWVHLWTPVPTASGGVPITVRPLMIADRLDRFAARGSGWSGVHLTNHSLFVHDIRLGCKLGRSRIQDLQISDWRQPLKALAARIKGNLKLVPLVDFLHASGRLDPKVKLQGQAEIQCNVLSRDPESQKVTVDFHGKKVSFIKGEKNLLTDEYFRVSSQLLGKLQDGDVDINEFVLESRPLNVRATGSLQRISRQQLELKGVMTPDLARIATLLDQATGLGLKMQGSRPESFHLVYPLTSDLARRKKNLLFSSQLQASRISLSGFDLSRLKMPVEIKNGRLETQITSQINGGRLSLAPRVQLLRKPMLLTVPKKTQILTDVQIGESLVKGFMGKLHPLFGTLARPAGVISASLDRFSWPLGPKGPSQADLEVLFDVSRVHLTATGILSEILHTFKIEDRELKLTDADITCTGRQGRISCSPVKVTVADSEMIFSGSIGFDKTLDYLAEIPVTRELVGKEGYRVLEGTTIRVPIRGTADNPSFDQDMITAAIGDLVKQAAGRAIEKQVEKVVPDLLDKLFK